MTADIEAPKIQPMRDKSDANSGMEKETIRARPGRALRMKTLIVFWKSTDEVGDDAS